MSVPTPGEVRRVTKPFRHVRLTTTRMFIAVLLIMFGAALWQFGSVGRLAEQNSTNLRIVRQATCPNVPVRSDPHGTRCITALKKAQAAQGSIITRIADAEHQRQILHDVCRVARANGVPSSELQGCS